MIWGIEPMRIRPIHTIVLAAGALLSSPALAEEYPLPVLSAVAYSDTGYEAEWSGGSYEAEGEVIYMDELEDGEEWRSGDYEDYEVRTVARREYDYDRGPPPPARTGGPLLAGERPLAYGEGERQAWLAECRGRMSQGHEYGVDSCADYLARYESGAGGYGYEYSYGYTQAASHGCGSCGCGCGGRCGGGNKGGCGCTVSYRFAPMPVMPVAQRQISATRRIVTTEEWEEEVPGKAVRVIPPPVVRTKIVPATPAPVKTIKTVKPRYAK
jgi:hypothetical protein